MDQCSRIKLRGWWVLFTYTAREVVKEIIRQPTQKAFPPTMGINLFSDILSEGLLSFAGRHGWPCWFIWSQSQSQKVFPKSAQESWYWCDVLRFVVSASLSSLEEAFLNQFPNEWMVSRRVSFQMELLRPPQRTPTCCTMPGPPGRTSISVPCPAWSFFHNYLGMSQSSSFLWAEVIVNPLFSILGDTPLACGFSRFW